MAKKKTSKTSRTSKASLKKTGNKTIAKKASAKKTAAKKTAGRSALKKKDAKLEKTATRVLKRAAAPKKAKSVKGGRALLKTSVIKGDYQGPRIGQAISDFALPATDGEFRLSQHKGQKVVLYFYPKDATPGCTLEGHEFSKLKNDFAAVGAVVMGVSRDDIESHQKFKNKQGYSVELISDVNEELCRVFDVIQEKNMYGKKMMGIERSTFLIDGDGRLAKEWRKVSVPGHAAEVLESVKAL